ncbi:MAG: acetyl-CoA hydrolase [Planctomycetota bacterium]|nr:MAG: acetyl-CoA hydrolase [Planctomycetota bacterium]
MSSPVFPALTAEEAAAFISHGDTVGFSGFTAAGSAKVVPEALAERAKALHADGQPFQIRVLAGASTGVHLDDALSQANAVSWRAPYQSSKWQRQRLNNGEMRFVDMHLSHLQQMVSEGFLGQVNVAVVEATEVTADGRIYLTSSIGASPTFLKVADRVIIEINRFHSPRVSEMADIATLPNPPHRSPIPLFHPLDRIGLPYVAINPKKIIGIVEHEAPDGVASFSDPDDTSQQIANNVVDFLLSEKASGRIPKEFLPLQSGVGNIANAVMAGLGAHEEVSPFHMYTEVLQDSVIDLMRRGKVLGASTCSLTLSDQLMREVYDDMDFFQERIVLRPQEISNNPGLVRRLGVITTNTALEVDIYGHVNSTHVSGTRMMNGLGGSGDFTRNAYISVFMCPSIAKGGRISTIVPMASHVDHSEHSVQVIITEQGVADLRGLGPLERASCLINNCAHPAYRPYLHDYFKNAPMGHIRHDLAKCFELHLNLQREGAMLPGLKI